MNITLLSGTGVPHRIALRPAHAQRRKQEMSDQRGRLTEAMVWVSATHGYAAASVERVGQRAGTSRRTFYTHFANREECFIAALEQGFARLHDALAACCADQDTSVARLQAAAWEVICLIEDEPKLTRMCVVEALAAGPAALEARRHALDRLAALIQDPAATGRPAIARALLGAGLDRLHDELTSPAARIDPVELYRQIAYPCLVLIAGPTAAGALALQPPPPRSAPPPRELRASRRPLEDASRLGCSARWRSWPPTPASPTLSCSASWTSRIPAR